jgi:[NiFe] hydrogenase assembly HybE family chaperone
MTRDPQTAGREVNPVAWGERLACAYREIGERAMRDLPVYNDALGVEAVGFRWFNGTIIGIMVTPWFMNVVMPAGKIAREASGSTLRFRFPAGDIEFTLSEVAQVERIASCSLFSPMFQFADVTHARATAEAAIAELMLLADSEEAVKRGEPATSAIDRRNFLHGVLTERRG